MSLFFKKFKWLLILTFIGANHHSVIPEQELRAGDSGVVHHVPTDICIHHAALVAAVYELQCQLKVIAYLDFQSW